MNFIFFWKLKNFKKHEFYLHTKMAKCVDGKPKTTFGHIIFHKLKKNSKNMNFMFCKLKNLKKHEFYFFASLKNFKKHEFHFFLQA